MTSTRPNSVRSGRPAARTARHGGVAAALAFCMLLGLARQLPGQEAGGQPAPSSAEAMRVAQGAIHQLERIRFNPNITADDVGDVLAPGLKALTPQDASGGEGEDSSDRDVSGTGEAARRLFVRGRLLTHAARALPTDPERREAYLNDAIDLFKNLRVEHRAVRIGLLGYIGEATAQRIAGRLDRAEAALQPVLPTDPARRWEMRQIVRLAVVERAEIALADGADRAIEYVEGAIDNPEFRDARSWRARLRWVEARAKIARLTRGAAGDASGAQKPPRERAEAIAEVLRDPDLMKIASDVERLDQLAALDRAIEARIMSAAERLDRAGTLTDTGRPDEALAIYRQLSGDDPDAFTSGDWGGYAGLLTDAGRFREAADALRRALDAAPSDSPQRAGFRRRRAVALERAIGEAPAEESAEVRARAIRAWARIIESDAPPEQRRHALRRWTWLTLRGEATFLDVRNRLAEHPSLVEGDAYLGYADAMSRWQHVKQRLSAGEIDRETARAESRALARSLRNIEGEAGTGPPLIGPFAVLGRARVLAEAPLDAPREALSVLEDRWEELIAHKPVAERVRPLRARLLFRLGMLDRARVAVRELPPSALGSELYQRVLAATADRYATLGPDERNRLRSRAIELGERAVAAVRTDGADYAEAVLGISEQLMRVEAFADARRLAGAARGQSPDALPVDLRGDLLAVEADALRRQGKLDEALKLIRDHETLAAGSTNAQLAEARCLIDLGEPSRALEAIRTARKAAEPGTSRWWRTTLLLSRTMKRTGKPGAAEEILRVAAVLYPASGGELKREIESLRETLQGSKNSAGAKDRAPATRSDP